MNAALSILAALAVSAIVFSLLWVVQKRTGDAGIVDVAWSLGVGISGAFFCWQASGDVLRRWVVAILVLVWGIRLSLHVFGRIQKMPEDGRYTEMKKQWGEQADWRMFRFYMFQAFAAVLFAIPMLIAATNSSPLGLLDYLGIAIWVFALTGESIADMQLNRFRYQPENKGKVCRDGLWKYSRHPNYFFEWLHWWSYVLLAITGAWGWLAIFAPLSMLFFILKVTGIPPTEKQAIKSRGEAYREYQRTTSPFFPWFPKTTGRTA